MLPRRSSKVHIPEQLKDKVAVGRIVRPRGLKGELRVQDFSSRPYIWEDMVAVQALLRNGSVKDLQIHEVRPGKGNQIFIQFTEIDSIEKAEDLKGSLLFSEQENMPQLDEDEFYVYELIGAEVSDVEGRLLGCIVDIQEYPAHDVFIVESEETGSRFPVPSVQEFVKEIDLDNGKVVVEMIDGLDEIEA